jgi:hypothetical protein
MYMKLKRDFEKRDFAVKIHDKLSSHLQQMIARDSPWIALFTSLAFQSDLRDRSLTKIWMLLRYAGRRGNMCKLCTDVFDNPTTYQRHLNDGCAFTSRSRHT